MTNAELKQVLVDAIKINHDNADAVDSAAEGVMAVITDDGGTTTSPVEQAVVDAVKTKGLVETFGEQALVTELESKGWTVTKSETPPVDPTV